MTDRVGVLRVARRLDDSGPLRRAVRRRLLGIVVAGAAAGWVGAQHRDATALRRSWGATTAVLVARADLPSGTEPTGADVTRVDWPTALVPPGAVRELPPRRHLSQPIQRGQAVVASQFTERRRGPWAAQLAADEVAVQVPLAAPLSGLAAGDVVDVIAPADSSDRWDRSTDTAGDLPGAASGALRTHRVASAARVLQVDGDGSVLAVPAARGAAVAAAALGGLVTLVVRP